MAAIGKIRSWGPVLVTVIGLALFAFIAEEMFRSCETSKNNERQQVGEVLGEKINVQDFQSLVDEYQQVIKMTQGRDNLSEEELNQVKDQVWNTYVSNKIIENEAEKLGLTVTDEELQNILREGTNPMLSQTPFVNAQTGRFDVTQLQKFLNDYKANTNPQVAEQYKSFYDYWKFIERSIRQQTLAQKYQALLANCMLSNPVSAKAQFDATQQEKTILLASLPYSTVKDDDVKVTNSELKAKYDEQKEMYKQTIETRNIKYVDFQVKPSQADRDELMKTMNDAYQKLQSGATAAEVVRKAQSQFPYMGLPVTKSALPSDIAARIDSIAVGQTTAPFETTTDNTLNVVKLLSKQLLPDSVEVRMIRVVADTEEATAKKADSIYNALKAGANFEEIAKKYGQDGQKDWLVSNQYQNQNTVDSETKTFLTALNTMAAGELRNFKFSQNSIVAQVTDRRAMVNKYDVAVIKHTIDFSKQTYSDAYNKFSQYVSENNSIEGLEKNAEKFGFKVSERNGMSNAEHYVAGIRATREAMKWIFDAKPGQVSPLYECGSNDHLLVIGLTKVNPAGYSDLETVKEVVTADVLRDKKFDALKGKFDGVKSIADAQAKGAKIDTVKQITFGSPVFVQATGSSEPILAGAVASTKAGQFHAGALKGNGGAYVFQVLEEKKPEGEAKFDAKATEGQLAQRAMQAASRFMQELYLKAGVTDKRYLFF